MEKLADISIFENLGNCSNTTIFNRELNLEKTIDGLREKGRAAAKSVLTDRKLLVKNYVGRIKKSALVLANLCDSVQYEVLDERGKEQLRTFLSLAWAHLDTIYDSIGKAGESIGAANTYPVNVGKLHNYVQAKNAIRRLLR